MATQGEYYKTRETVEEYIRLSQDVNGKVLIEKLHDVLPPNSTILELGTGPGTDWRILSKSYSVTGSDNSPMFLNHLATENPSGVFLELDAGTLSTNQKYNCVYSNKVLHHLTDDELANSVKRQHAIMQPNGIICHSFWKGEGWEVFKGLFVNYHTHAAIKTFFESHFEILSLDDYAEFEEDDSLVMIARKK